MFSNFAWSEMLVIACVAIIVVGPKDLPGMLRSLGKTIGNVKRMASDFQSQFNDAIKDAELDEITDLAKNKTIAPLKDAKDAMDDFAKTMTDPLDKDQSKKTDTPKVAATSEKKSEKPAASKPKAVAKKAAPKKTTATPTKASAAKKASETAQKPAPKKAAPKKAAPRKTAAKTTDAKVTKSTL